MSQQDQPDQRIALVAGLIREVPDFPKPGILFKDITPLLASAEGFHACTTLMRESVADLAPDTIVGVEARGFLFGVALATQLSLGFVPVRKPGKLPAETLSVSYELEYGSDSLEIHRDALRPGARVAWLPQQAVSGSSRPLWDEVRSAMTRLLQLEALDVNQATVKRRFVLISAIDRKRSIEQTNSDCKRPHHQRL